MASNENTRILPEIGGATVGTQLSGIYELDERIASGGMGEVYRGHNIETNDPVAIKIVLPEFARDPTILSLFRKEASILFHLSHDAIVRYHVFTVDPGIGRPYMAMEFVNGISALELMESGPMAPEEVRKLCIRIASGLATAHEAGVIHRDLSPDNIIVVGGKVERAKIIDFGIARSANVGGETLLGGKFAGKYNYVSPEQLGLYGADVTDRSDIYSLGLVLAAMLRGKPIDMSGSQVDVIDKRRKVPDLSDVDAAFRPLLEAMLQPDPADRPNSMNDVVALATQSKAGPAPQDTRTVIQQRPTTQAPSASPVATQPPAAPPRQADTWSLAAEDAPPTVPPAHPAHQASAVGPGPASAGEATPRPQDTPPVATQAPPTSSESPFGPYVPPAEVPFTRGVPAQPASASAAAAPSTAGTPSGKRGVGAGLIAAAAGVVLVLAGGGAYFSGLLGPSEQVPTTPVEQPEPTTPSPQVQPEPQPAPTSAPEPQPAPTQAPEPQPAPTQAPEPQPAPTQAPEPQPAPTPVPQPTPSQPEPPVVIDKMAQIIGWLKDYPGGACSFATATAVTDKTTDIEAFGTSVAPFEVMLRQFEERFGMEPNISVRLLEPDQCIVADFLRTLSNSRGRPPQLSLAETLIANGGTLTGDITPQEGRHSDLILVDHRGVAYNLNSRLVESGTGKTFSIKLGLGAADLAKQESVPQLVVAVISDNGIDAANFTGSVPAAELFPRISEEMSKAPDANAVAKYFRLGG